MAHHVARYTLSFGLAGCYMPDYVTAPQEYRTRGELADAIRHELEFHDMPASLFRDVNIRRLWGFIRRNGSSVAHFSLTHKGYTLAFHGLTQEEYEAGQSED